MRKALQEKMFTVAVIGPSTSKSPVKFLCTGNHGDFHRNLTMLATNMATSKTWSSTVSQTSEKIK